MQIYLSSYRLGDHGDRLVEMAGGRGAPVAVITNALDNIPLETQSEYAKSTFDPISYFKDSGFAPTALDLRDYFGDAEGLLDLLLHHKVIFAVGGNAYLLRRAMRESGFDDLLEDLTTHDLIYAGWSAGACVAGTSLRAISVMDEPNADAPGYDNSEPIWDGLGLAPFSIIPHYQSDHPESPLADKAVSFAKEQHVEYMALRDGEVLVSVGDQIQKLPRSE